MKRFLLIALTTFLAVFALGGAALIYVGRDEIKMPEPIQIVEEEARA